MAFKVKKSHLKMINKCIHEKGEHYWQKDGTHLAEIEKPMGVNLRRCAQHPGEDLKGIKTQPIKK